MHDESVEEVVKRRNESKRREFLMRVLVLIGNGEIDSSKELKDNNLPRKDYLSLNNYDDYNFGYMIPSEMATSATE